MHSFLNLALHEAALGQGDFETAYQCATAIAPPGQVPPICPSPSPRFSAWWNSAVRTGRHQEAVAHVRAVQEANLQAISSRLALLVGGAQAMVAGDDATDLFQRAIGIPGADRWPFDLARVELAFGEHLRRRRAVTDARVHLTTALDTFDALGARPWSTRAATELRAAGSARRPTDLGRGEALTVQELEVASLAATGMTNKQIAEKLHMSPRTVGTHLYRTYPKLGIPSRAALRDALAALGVERRAR